MELEAVTDTTQKNKYNCNPMTSLLPNPKEGTVAVRIACTESELPNAGIPVAVDIEVHGIPFHTMKTTLEHDDIVKGKIAGRVRYMVRKYLGVTISKGAKVRIRDAAKAFAVNPNPVEMLFDSDDVY